MDYYQSLLNDSKNLDSELFGKDFLLTWEKSLNELELIINIAELLGHLYKSNISCKVYETGLAVSQFRDKSTRTRFSYNSAANLLGLNVCELDESKSQIAHGETVRETSNMISFLTDIIGIRDDMYLGEGNAYMREVANALDQGFNEGVLNQRPNIINLQCDIDHPTQSMSDLLHLKNYFGSLDNLKGKKIAVSWAYSPSYGKPLSVPQGLICLLPRLGMDVVLAHPEGYELIPECITNARKFAKSAHGKFSYVSSMDEAFLDCDVVYPKSWAPYSVMEKRTKLLKSNDEKGLLKLEEACLKQNANFIDWECNMEKMKATKNGDALYMHCLPADISGVSCKRGEVSEEVFEKYRIETYKEASNKPFIIAAMILTSRFKDPIGLIERIMKDNIKRIK